MVRLALVTSVTWRPVRFQISQRVHRPEQHLAGLGALAQAGHVCRAASAAWGRRSRWPAAARSARGSGPGRRRRRARGRAWSVRVSCQMIALCTGAPVSRSQSDGRLALVGDAERRRGRTAASWRVVERVRHDLHDVAPDLLGVVLDPARAREDLLVLLLGDRDDAGRAVEDDAARGRGALVDRRDVLLAHRHALSTKGSLPGRVKLRGRPRARTPPASPRGWRAASRRSGGPETPIAPTVTPAAVEDRRRARHLAVDELADVGRPAALAHALELALQGVGDR